MSTKSTRRSMSDVMPVSQTTALVRKASEFINIPLVLLSFEEHDASPEFARLGNDSYYLISVELRDNYPNPDPEAKATIISIGAHRMKQQLEALNAVEDLPIDITIKVQADGKTLYME